MNTVENQHALAQINAGLHALRCALTARMPSDFFVTFNVSPDDVHAVYWWAGDIGARYQQEVRASDAGSLLIAWQAIDWPHERRLAKEEARTS